MLTTAATDDSTNITPRVKPSGTSGTGFAPDSYGMNPQLSGLSALAGAGGHDWVVAVDSS